MGKRGFRNTGLRFGSKMSAIVAALALAMVFGGCETEAEVERFTVTFSANQGQGTPPLAQTVVAGTVIELPGPGNLNRPGFAFEGWNTQADGQGTNLAVGSDFTVNANVTLFARWEQLQTEIERFTVTFSANQGQGTPPVAQTVDVGTVIELPGPGNLNRPGFTFEGWNTQTDGQGTDLVVGSDFTVSADVTLFARWVQPQLATLSIAGLPAGAGWVDMILRDLAGQVVFSDEEHASGGIVEFNLVIVPGDYNIHLSFGGDGRPIHYRTPAPVRINLGSNSVTFGQFVEIVPITITVTGIPANAIEAQIELFDQAGDRVARGRTWWTGSASSANFYLMDNNDDLFTTPGTYEVRLTLWGENDFEGWHTIGAYRIASRSITESNNRIEFNQFQAMPPITVTVTGVPADFHGYLGSLVLVRPGEDVSEESVVGGTDAVILEATTPFIIHGVIPGTYDLMLVLMDEETDGIVGVHTASSMTITATGPNNIAWGAFTNMPLSRVTITGIHADYEGAGANIMLGNIMTEEIIATGRGRVVDGSLTGVLFDFQTHWLLNRTISSQVAVSFEREVEQPGGSSSWETSIYTTTTSVNFPAGQNTTVEWALFVDIGGMFSFSAEPEPTMSGRSGARLRSLRAR